MTEKCAKCGKKISWHEDTAEDEKGRDICINCFDAKEEKLRNEEEKRKQKETKRKEKSEKVDKKPSWQGILTLSGAILILLAIYGLFQNWLLIAESDTILQQQFYSINIVGYWLMAIAGILIAKK